MGKRDYVLEKALAGDLDAIENVLGQVYAPLFDLAHHLQGQVEATHDPLVAALRHLADGLIAGELGGSTPFLVAARALIVDLDGRLPARIDAAAPIVAGLERRAALALLARHALDLDGPELDEALGLAGGRGERLAEAALAELAVDEDELRDRLDEVSSRVALPEGLVDAVMDELDRD